MDLAFFQIQNDIHSSFCMIIIIFMVILCCILCCCLAVLYCVVYLAVFCRLKKWVDLDLALFQIQNYVHSSILYDYHYCYWYCVVYTAVFCRLGA